MGFRSYVRHFRGAILGLLRPSEAWCFPAGRWFFPWCFPSGNQQQQQQKSVQQQEEKVAKMHSSSYSYTTTIMGFRSYVRHFRGAILGLLRPSEAWCFPAGRWFFPWCFPSGSQQQQQKSVQQQEEKVAKMHSSSYSYTTTIMGFRSYVRHFRGAILGLLRPSEAWCFPAGRWFFPWCFPSGSQQQQQQKAAKVCAAAGGKGSQNA